jgi:DNA-binding transcriptional ArsR family regulator
MTKTEAKPTKAVADPTAMAGAGVGPGTTAGPIVRGRPLSEVKAELFRALAHPARIRVLEVLAEGERTVSELQPLVGIESSHLSQQLGILRRAGLVTNRKDGTSVLYAVRDQETIVLLASARRLLINSFSETRDLLHDLLDERPRG